MRENTQNNFRRILALAIIVLLIFGTFVFRLAQWQIVDGAKYLSQSDETSSSYSVIKAPRGEILDKDGNKLISNKTVYNIVFNAAEMPSSERNNTIYKLILLMEQCGAKWIDVLPIERTTNGDYAFKANSDSEISYMKSSSMLYLNEYATANDCVKTMISDDYYNIKGYEDDYILKIASVRYNMQRSSFSIRYPYTFAEDISIDTVTVINEHLNELPGVSVETSAAREYNASSLAPHIIGYTGSLSAEEYTALKDEGKTFSADNYGGYLYSDKIGKSGIELVMEDELRGTNGKKIVNANADGTYTTNDEKTIDPIPGNTVFLTLNSNLQDVANNSLAKNVVAAQANGQAAHDAAVARGDKSTNFGEDCKAGAVVVLDAKTFGVLAMSTYPTYDLQKSLTDSEYYSSLLKDDSTPLVNRATSGTYTPGSIFKPSVALGALQEGAITSSTQFTCTGVYNNPDFTGYNPTCMGTHGTVTVTTALEQSCNIFFYEVGYRLGIRSMNTYCTRLGLGVKTGIEIGERTGILAGPEEYLENHGEAWTDGLTVMSAIGQSDNSFTPLQLATYCATIANNGVRLNSHIIDKVTDYSRSDVVYQTPSTVMADLGVDQTYIDKVKEGMGLVCSDRKGTAYRFANYGIKIAAKTGTATTVEGVHSDNATFIAFAPYDNPEIAVAIVFEYGAKGTYVQNVAQDIFDAYFYGKTSADLFPPQS